MNLFTRRDALHSAAVAAGLAAIGANPDRGEAAPNAAGLKTGDVILFQGDSITDARRDRKSEAQANNPRMLGHGYPALLASQLLLDKPTLGLQIYNRGISGNKVPDLDARWDKDCIDLKPDLLSILIGVNDIWHKLNGRYDGTVETYRKGFAALLDRTREALPETTLVICEPFALRCGAVNESWFPEMDNRRTAAAEVARNANVIWVPFQTVFDEAIAAGTEPKYWANDGVHPTIAGHALMAQAWRQAVGI